MGKGQSKDCRTSLTGSVEACYVEATPGITTWLNDENRANSRLSSSGLSETQKKSILKRNEELREALGLASNGTNNLLPLYQTRYYTDCSDDTENSVRWVTGGAVFPLFYMPGANDIDNSRFSWLSKDPKAKIDFGSRGFDEPYCLAAMDGTHYGWILASHQRLTRHEDPTLQDKFPYGRFKQPELSHLHKAQGFYGITIACDNKTVDAQNAKAIVINQLAYPLNENESGWKDGPHVPFTRMVFMHVLGEYEYNGANSDAKTKHRICTAWRDYIMQEIVFIDFCYKDPFNDGARGQLRKFFGQVASMNEAYGWHHQLAIGKPKVWSDALKTIQARIETTSASGLSAAQRYQLSQLVSSYVFRIPPDMRALFLPDDEIKSGDQVQLVFDWPTCRRIGFNGAYVMGSFETSSRLYTITATDAKAGSEIKTATSILLQTAQGGPSSGELKLTFTGALKSGMRVQIHDKKGPLGITPHTSAVKSQTNFPRTAAAVINSINSHTGAFHFVNPQEAHLRNWVIYKKSAASASSGSLTALDASQATFVRRANPRSNTNWGCEDKDPNDATKNLPYGSRASKDEVEVACMASSTCLGYYSSAGKWHIATDKLPEQCLENGGAGYTDFYAKPARTTTGTAATGTPTATLAAGTTGGVLTPTTTSTTPAQMIASDASTTPAQMIASDASGDWAVSYALTQKAVASASLFSIDAVAYFGDKEKTAAPTRTLALDEEKRPLLGAALSALVRSAVAYDAVEYRTLLSTIPRPSTIDESDEAALGVLSVRRDSGIELLCLASNARLAQSLKALPSSRTLTDVSFAQMQLMTDFTSSYFMRPNETKLGKVICRAFRLVPYNLVAAIAILLLVLVAIAMDERSPVAATRIIRKKAQAGR